MNTLKMEIEKFHFCRIILNEFQKGVRIETATKTIQMVYLDGAPATQTVKNWFGKSHLF